MLKCNQSRPGFELVSPCSFLTTITIIPRAPLLKILYSWHVFILKAGICLFFLLCWMKILYENICKNKQTHFFGIRCVPVTLWLTYRTAASKKVNLDSSRAVMFHCGLISLGKAWNPNTPSYVLYSIAAVLLQEWF